MNQLVWTSHFQKSAEKFIKRNPELVGIFKTVISTIEQDPFDQSLKTHKLKGKLSGYYASSLDYSHWIVFEFDIDNNDRILLHKIGSHDEVY